MEFKEIKQNQAKFQREHKDLLWEISGIYDVDRTNIDKWLETEADAVMSPNIGAPNKDRGAMIKEAYKHYESLSEKLKGLYQLGAMPVGSKLMDDANKGVLHHKAPTLSTILSWGFTALIALFAEMGVIGFLLSMGASPVLIVMGLLLLVFLLMGGKGLGTLLINIHGYETDPDEKRPWPWKTIILPIVCLSGLTAISVMRATSSHSYITGLIIFLLGIAAIVAEGFFFDVKKAREYYKKQIFLAQLYYAATHLTNDLGDFKDPFDDTWYLIYQGKVNLIAKKITDAVDRKSTQPVRGDEALDTQAAG